MKKVAVIFIVFTALMATIAVAVSMNRLSIPSLEDPACDAARDATKSFYSFHFGNDLAPSAESLANRARFLTPSLQSRLAARADDSEDYFTATSDYPKAFRIGGCQAVGPDKVAFEIALFWKDDERSEQRAIRVTSVFQDGKWLVDEVSPQNR